MQLIMNMKMVRILISNTCVIYYSAKGNTKAIVNEFEKAGFTIYKVKDIRSIDFDKYNNVVFATSTWGRGLPAKHFFNVRDVLLNISNKNIGLFGSGQSHYEYFCGALDLLEEMLSPKNSILFKYKYEGYPKEIDFNNMRVHMEELKCQK